jgi:putative peptidoglycan lipid II flippase
MILKNSIIIGIFSILSVLLGMLRDRLLAEYVGIGTQLDLYNAAFRLPDLALGILLSFAASATIIPFLSKAIDEKNTEEIERRVSTLFVFFGTLMTALSVFVIVTIPLYAKFIVPGFSVADTESFILYTRILMIQPIFLGLSTLISTVAQSKHQFYIYGVAPLVYTTAIILSIIFGYQQFGVMAMIVGVLCGALLHVLLQSISLVLLRIRIRPSMFSFELVKEQLKISLPRSGSHLIIQLRLIFFTAVATTVGAGALSIYLFAQRIIDAIIQIIPQSISTASLPSLSLHSSREDTTAYTAVFIKNVISILVISLAVALGVFLLAKYIVLILFGDTGYNQNIIDFLLVLVIGLPFAALSNYVTTAFSARKETRILLFMTLFSTICGIVVVLFARGYGYGILSIAYGTVSISVIYILLSIIFYFKRIQKI